MCDFSFAHFLFFFFVERICWHEDPTLRPTFGMILKYLKELRNEFQLNEDISNLTACAEKHMHILKEFKPRATNWKSGAQNWTSIPANADVTSPATSEHQSKEKHGKSLLNILNMRTKK